MSTMGADTEDPNPDIHDLFCHYNALYFEDSLGACFVSWSPKRMNACAGVCHYPGGGSCEILLSEPLLKSRPSSDLKNTLLHEMIHAYLWIKNKNKTHSEHGPNFQKLMNDINSSSVNDHQRPYGGYHITTNHSFNDEVDRNRVCRWQCQLCGNLIKCAMNREPSANDCIEKSIHDGCCGNLSCQWHMHKLSCTGNYKKIAGPLDYKDKRKVSEVRTELAVPPQPTKSTWRAYIEEGSKAKSDAKSDALKLNTAETFYPIVKEANQNVVSPSPSSDDKLDNGPCHKVDEQTVEAATQNCAAPATSGPSATHTSRKRKSTCVASKRCREHENNYTVIINWMSWYANEDDEEDVELLHNKRTERRMKQKLLKNPTDICTELQAIDDPSCTKSEKEFDMDPINCGKAESWNSMKGHPQAFLAGVNDSDDRLGKGLHECDDNMQFDTSKTSQGCVVRPPLPVSKTLSVDVHDSCRKTVTLDSERDDIVDLIDID